MSARPTTFSKLMAVFDISQPLANALYGLSNVVLIVGALAALMGTIGTIWTAGVLDRYSDQRISANETETAKANAQAATANAEAQKSAADAAQARLETEKLRAHFAWRRMTQAQFDRLTASLRRLRPQLEGKLSTWVYNEGEAASLADQINAAIEKAGYRTMSSGGQSGGKVPFYGVRVDNQSFPKEGRLLRDALVDAGIKADLGPAQPMMPTPSALYLYVSVREPPQ